MPENYTFRFAAGFTGVLAPVYIYYLDLTTSYGPPTIITFMDRLKGYLFGLVFSIGFLAIAFFSSIYFIRNPQARVYCIFFLFFPIAGAAVSPFADPYPQPMLLFVPWFGIGLFAVACIIHILKLRENNA